LEVYIDRRYKNYAAQVDTALLLLDAIAEKIEAMPAPEVDRVTHAHLGKMIEVCLTLSRVSHDLHNFVIYLENKKKGFVNE
jgi:hypothetical protein